jgi:Zn-dependent protease
MAIQPEVAVMNVALLCILTVPHEFAHAWAATKLGDDTPEREGRLTLYPPAHIDLIGTIILPALTSLFGGGLLGWGKPVNTNVSKLRYGLWGLLLVAMAGPASNLVLTLLMAGISVLTGRVVPEVSEIASHGALLSTYLALFNLIPVPPLDGSKLLLLARVPMVVYYELSRFGFLLLMLLMSATNFGLYIGGLSRLITEHAFGLFYW